MQVNKYTLLLSAVLLGLAGCSPADGMAESSQTVYLPYVETVEFPPRMVAGEQFSATLVLSCARTPGLLDGISAADLGLAGLGTWGMDATSGSGSIGLSPVVYAFRRKSGPAASRFALEIIPAAPGNYELRIWSADTADWGGFAGKTLGGDPSTSMLMAPHPHRVTKVYPFSVTAD